MFAQTFVDVAPPPGKPWSMAISLVLQCAAVTVLLIVPLLHPEVLHPTLTTSVWVPVRLAPEPPKPSAVRAATPSATVRPLFTAPARIPARVANIVDKVAEAAPEAVGVYMPGVTGAASVFPADTLPLPTPEKPQPKPQPPVSKPPDSVMRVSGSVQAARLLFGPKPAYPRLAVTTRVQGTVKLQANISSEGRIVGLQVMEGPPLLINAAVEAVKQWRYQPTLLNSVPVQVLTEIDVIFTLSN